VVYLDLNLWVIAIYSYYFLVSLIMWSLSYEEFLHCDMVGWSQAMTGVENLTKFWLGQRQFKLLFLLTLNFHHFTQSAHLFSGPIRQLPHTPGGCFTQVLAILIMDRHQGGYFGELLGCTEMFFSIVVGALFLVIVLVKYGSAVFASLL